MSIEKKLKILLIGPVGTGKTTIANFLSDAIENLAGETRPTKGVRIVEFSVQGVRAKNVYQRSVEIELWDTSGDDKYQSCWPAIKHEADGIVFVYSEASDQQKTSLDLLFSFFVEESDFPESRCLVVRNQIGHDRGSKFLENPLPALAHTVVNLDEKGAEFRRNFNSFLSNIMKTSLND